MKRRKQRCAPSPQMNGLPRTNYDFPVGLEVEGGVDVMVQISQNTTIYGSPMKTYTSSPDIPQMNSFDSMEDDAPTPLPTHDLRR